MSETNQRMQKKEIKLRRLIQDEVDKENDQVIGGTDQLHDDMEEDVDDEYDDEVEYEDDVGEYEGDGCEDEEGDEEGWDDEESDAGIRIENIIDIQAVCEEIQAVREELSAGFEMIAQEQARQADILEEGLYALTQALIGKESRRNASTSAKERPPIRRI